MPLLMNKNLSQLFNHKEGLDTRSAQFLMKALESNNLPGFDYIEFKQSLGALLAMNMEMGTAFKSAFATASTMGLTKKHLLESITHYKEVLLKEKGQFDIALKNRIEQRVGAKVEENKHHEVRLKQIEDQIKRLQEESVQIKEKITKNEESKSLEGNKLSAQQVNFEKTFVLIKEEMDMDIVKINQYL